MEGASISRSSPSKVEVPVLIFKVGLRLPTNDFFDEIMCQYGFFMDDLTPKDMNNIVGFELPCQTLGVLPHIWAFKAYFNSSMQSGVHTFSQRRNIHTFIINQKAPEKNG